MKHKGGDMINPLPVETKYHIQFWAPYCHKNSDQFDGWERRAGGTDLGGNITSV